MSEELEMSLDLEEEKATGDESVAADSTTGAGGSVKKRKGDLKKSTDKEDDIEATVKTPQGTNNTGLKEAVERLFEGTELSEDFKDKTIAIFEAAVHEKVLAEKAVLEEKFEGDLQEQIDVAVEELVEKVDAYLDYVVENWMDDNMVQIESNLKVEVAESLLSGIKGLVTEHNMEIDDVQIDAVATLEAKLEESTSKYNELVEQMIEVRDAKQKSDLEVAFKDISEDLTDTQADKLRVLSEGVSYETVADYSKKLTAIRDSYFTEATIVAEDETDLLQEESVDDAKTPISLDNPMISRYADALGRFAAK
jgi:predicted SpoU family rRNA methylase